MISKNTIKHIQSLHLKKNREEYGLFIIEGVKLVTEFLNNNSFEITDLYATTNFIEENEGLLNKKRISIHKISDDELKKISQLNSPNQVLAIVKSRNLQLDPTVLQKNTVLFLDDIRDPGNLGTIIRIADWFGINNIICSETTTELYNPKVIQASMGAVLRVNVIYMGFEKFVPFIKNLPIYGAVLNGKNIYQSELKKGIIIIGNESNGISKETLKYISNPITIPSANSNGSESLNAANACAIICGEFYRQLNEI